MPNLPCYPSNRLWGGSKGVINFLWIFYAMRSLVPVGQFCNISRHLFTWLVCVSVQWRYWLLLTDCIVWDEKDNMIGYKRSHWILLGRWSMGFPKLQLFQLSQHSYVTKCWLISSSAFFPWNMTLKYQMQLFEDSWDKTTFQGEDSVFLGRNIFYCSLSVEAIHQSSGGSFCNFHKDHQGKVTTHLEPLHKEALSNQ